MNDDSVVKALAKVIADLPAIGKGDKSPQGYSFRGIEAITKHLQPLLARHGVVIVPNATVTSVVPSPAMKDSWQDVYVTVQWTIYGPDGSSITACTTGIGRDNADKGVNKAQTQAFKYLLLHMLCIADAKDDADQADYSHGYDSRRQAQSSAARPSDKAVALFERVKATKDTPLADVLRGLAAENNRKLTVADLDTDPTWAELVKAVINGESVNGK
jgi:phytoene dehydrogenase-like protein